MAGSYPDVPSRRMAYDEDSVCVVWASGYEFLITEATPTQKLELNDEDYTVAIGGGSWFNHRLVTIFPELRELDGAFVNTNGYTIQPLQTSTDTTNGADGTWVTQTTPPTITTTSPAYRNSITSYAVSNVRGVRWGTNGNTNYYAQHLYGIITPGQTPDRLLWVDTATALAYTLPIDFGDVPRGSASDTTVKLRNNSSSLTASTVQVTAESLYLTSGNWYTFSEGGAFQSTLLLASAIGPAADSPTITVRRIVPDAETLGLHAGRLQASVGSWA